MAYDINHKKHIESFFKNNQFATAEKLAEALPKKKRKKMSPEIMTYTLRGMCGPGGRVIRLARGIYGWWTKPPRHWEVAAYDNALATTLLSYLVERRNVQCDLSTLWLLAGDIGFTPTQVTRKLLKLKRLGLVQGRGQKWSITHKATELVYPAPDFQRVKVGGDPAYPEPQIDIFS